MWKHTKKSIVQADTSKCYLTGLTTHLDRHHCMPGTANRRKAEEDGLWVMLNHDIHMYLHNTSEGRKKLTELEKEAQRCYEKAHSHEEWMKRYKKNYL